MWGGTGPRPGILSSACAPWAQMEDNEQAGVLLLVLYDLPRFGMVWYDLVWCCAFLTVCYQSVFSNVFNSIIWYCMMWYGMVLYGMVWYGMVWYVVEWRGCGTVPGYSSPGTGRCVCDLRAEMENHEKTDTVHDNFVIRYGMILDGVAWHVWCGVM